MKCPDCGFKNPEGMRFCGHCGSPLCNVCPNCDCSNPVEFRFCGSCGSPLTPPQTGDDLAKLRKYIPSYLAKKIQQSRGRIEGERKNVTAVFADISGFTAMAETHDPEEISSIVTICHTMLGDIIYRYEGIVDKIVGDGLMAIFGTPVHEDDPERAILASIDMQQGMAGLSQEFEENMGISLGLSIGINTGVVILGDIGTSLRLDYTVMGDVVNTAARMEEAAKSGEILVAQETYRRSAHCFDFQELGPATVKGKSQPVRIYKVLGHKEKTLRARGIEGLQSPLVGRDEEFAVCTRFVEQLMTGKGGTLLITGEAGFGKSRLTREVKEYAGSRNITWLEGKCVSYSHSINYWVFVDVLRDYLDVKNDASAVEIEREIRKKRLMDSVGESTISTISSLLSSELGRKDAADDLDESEKKLRIFSAVKDILAAESQRKPLILALDDLHWADELSMELLLFLMKELSLDQVTFICIYRPVMGEHDLCPAQRLEDENPFDNSARYAKISLSPLSNIDSNALLESLLAAEDLPPEMKSFILGKAGGNPLYLEEVIRSIIDDKAIEQRDGRWLAVKEVEEIEVPSTVQGVIMARIDRLEEEPKHILQCASVVGRSFEYAALSYLVAEGIQPGQRSQSRILDGHLEQLGDMGFISSEEDDRTTFRFRHALIQDVTYSTILKRRRRELHENVCHHIEETHWRYLDDFCEILAYHYSNSNDMESAISYLIKAGNKNRKSSTGSAESALKYFNKALVTLSDSSQIYDDHAVYEQNIHDGMGEAYKDLGQYEKALSSFETVLEVAKQTRNLRVKGKALRQIANSKTLMGNWEDALEAYEGSLAIVRGLGDFSQMGFVYNGIGYGYLDRGDLDKAMEHFQEALMIGKQSGDLRLIGDASDGLGTIASIRHDFDEAIRNYQISLRSYEEAEESHYVAQTYQNLGITYFKGGEPEIADRYYAKSLNISEKCGYNSLIACTYLNRAELSLWQSDLDSATDFCVKAFQILHTLDDKGTIAEGYKLYGMIHRRQQDLQSAQEAFQTSLEVSRECDDSYNIAEVHREMGLVYEERGMPEEALVHLDKSREIFGELSIVDEVQKADRYIARIRQESNVAISSI
ncbi:tetratricopeptide repeat protein [Candidatus Poribacteria bacterium]